MRNKTPIVHYELSQRVQIIHECIRYQVWHVHNSSPSGATPAPAPRSRPPSASSTRCTLIDFSSRDRDTSTIAPENLWRLLTFTLQDRRSRWEDLTLTRRGRTRRSRKSGDVQHFTTCSLVVPLLGLGRPVSGRRWPLLSSRPPLNPCFIKCRFELPRC